MKKVLYTLLAVSIIFSACKKEDEVVTPTEINGCTDSTATNYNSTATTMMVLVLTVLLEHGM
jgi:hypothetical protein